MVKLALEHFKYTPAKPKAEGDRVEINLDTQVLTVFKNWQPILITTTSTGSGEHFCGGTDGCQYAITPAGHYHFYYLHRGLGQRASSARCGTRTTSTVASRCTGSQSVPVVPRVARLRAHPDAHRRLLPDARHEGRVGVRGRHAEAARQRVRRPVHATADRPRPPPRCRPRRAPPSRPSPPPTKHHDAHHEAAPGHDAAPKTSTTPPKTTTSHT